MTALSADDLRRAMRAEPSRAAEFEAKLAQLRGR